MSKRVKIIIGVLFLGILAFVVFTNFQKWHKRVVKREITQEQKKWQEQTYRLEQKVAELEDELSFTREQPDAIPPEKVSQALGKTPEKVTEKKKKENTYRDVETQVAAIFSYLDQQDYVIVYDFKGGTYYEFRQAVNLISTRPPVVTGETDNLYRLMSNMAFFYRTLGKERVALVNDVLYHESEILEPVMGTFFNWFTMPSTAKPKLQGRPPFRVLYEISGFFLNSLAGQSYLFRRDPKVRTLTRYFCVLILDMANDKKLNRFGIDIRPHIKKLYAEIKSTVGLAERKEYLTRLNSLAEKYKM